MKNTVKKILALVFAVVMVCSLAVPALAAEEETVGVSVTVITYDKSVKPLNAGVAVKASKANVEEALDAFNEIKDLDEKYIVDVVGTTGLVKEVGGYEADEVDEENAFNTGYWAVALNGKLVSEDLGTVAIEEGDRIVVYWNDPTFDTKLVQVDDSLIAKGVLSYYYFDAEGNQKPLKNATVILYSTSTNGVGLEDKITGENEFVTDDEGQIWIAPEYLDGSNGDKWIAASSVTIKALKAVDDKDGYTAREVAYYNNNLDRNIEAGDVKLIRVDIENMYNTADATGDMTMVYVLVAAAAVITLAAVVVMKKKAVKAN